MWSLLNDVSQLNAVVEKSHTIPCLIFKHSTRCSISSIALHRLESDWPFTAQQLEPFYLDLIAYRDISHQIAERFQVWHESPQVLLIKNGECLYDASHLDISVEEIKEQYQSLPA